jgi:hypothetical protein
VIAYFRCATHRAILTEIGKASSNHLTPIPDIVAYQAEADSIRESEVQRLLTLPKFRAAAVAFTSGLVPLGYAAFFSWEGAKEKLTAPTPRRLMDVIRYMARRNKLDVADPRHIRLDSDQAHAEFPHLFQRANPSNHSRRREVHAEYLREIGDFAADHPWRAFYQGDINFNEETSYAKYWLQSSPEVRQRFLSDRRFLAGLDAYHQGIIDYGGFLENVFGDNTHVLFSELGTYYSALALAHLAQGIDRGEVTIPEDLREEFPHFYE